MCVKSGHAFEFQETRDTAKGRRMVKTWALNGKCEDEVVFGSKTQAAWVWTAGDTNSDLLTDDDQFGRKGSEPVTVCRREL